MKNFKQFINENNSNKIIAYHGTSVDFDEFDIKKMIDKEGKDLNLGWGRGVINFTDSLSEARAYAKRWDSGTPQIIEVELTINNPFYIGSYRSINTKLSDGYARFQRVRDGFVDTVDRNIWWGKIRGHKNLRMEAFVKQLKKEGYDGIIEGDKGLGDMLGYVVFKIGQIKIINKIPIE